MTKIYITQGVHFLYFVTNTTIEFKTDGGQSPIKMHDATLDFTPEDVSDYTTYLFNWIN